MLHLFPCPAEVSTCTLVHATFHSSSRGVHFYTCTCIFSLVQQRCPHIHLYMQLLTCTVFAMVSLHQPCLMGLVISTVVLRTRNWHCHLYSPPLSSKFASRIGSPVGK